VDTPETRYAKSDGIDIAYQSFGTGEVTMVAVPPAVANIDLIWEDAAGSRYLRRLSSFCHFIHFDKRGMGMSERSIGTPTLEQRVDDLRAVMDAEGVERAVIGGLSEGGLMAAYFASTYPERTIGLILNDTFPRLTRTTDYDIGLDESVFEQFVDQWADGWGTPDSMTVGVFCPSKVGDANYFLWNNRFERHTVSPGGLRAMMRLNGELDIRAVLPTISVPTLVIHRTGDLAVPVEHGRYLADQIPDARYVELPGLDHLPWFCAAPSTDRSDGPSKRCAREDPVPCGLLPVCVRCKCAGQTTLGGDASGSQPGGGFPWVTTRGTTAGRLSSPATRRL
jgi:pimeloyl-ACP methyl ester carboxylesterase